MSEDTDYKPHSHLPYGVEGSGHYSDAVLGCFSVVKAGTALTLNSLDKIPFNSNDGAFVICDYGTADGGTSMFLIRDVIDKVQEKYGEEQQVHVIYEDQPVNDFKSLLLRMHGFIPDPPSYLTDHNNVFVTCCGTSFFSQCLPDNSVHLGFCSTAMHWLSNRPCNISGGGIHHTFIKDEGEKRLFAEKAARDWDTILLHRAKEMKPGGQLVILSFCLDEAGQHLGKTNTIPCSMLERMMHHWKTMLVDSRITQEEFDNASLNNYYRTKEEYSAPFNDPQSAVSRAGLKLCYIQTKVVQCPYHQRWKRQGQEGGGAAAKKLAHLFVGTIRPWSNHTFFAALSEDRAQDERSALVDEFYQRYEDEVAKNPNNHAMDYVHAYIHIAKNK